MDKRFFNKLDEIYHGHKITKVILAVSGGVDSVVMAELFHKSGKPFSLAHCNFQLRGEESDADARFVEELALSHNVECHQNIFATEEYAKNEGVSIQMAARELRYSWFKELSAADGVYIATAHHANDVAETLLFNLAKGTGIAGLHGIATLDHQLMRPLLWATKEEIRQYAVQNGLKWRDDESNNSDKYNRNLIRHKVVPIFEKINPSFINAISKTSSRIQQTEAFVKFAIKELGLLIHDSDRILIDKQKLQKIDGASAVLYDIISPYGFNYVQTDDLLNSLNNTGAIFNASHWQINVDREYIILTKNRDKIDEVIIDAATVKLEHGKYIYQFNIEDASIYPIKSDPNIAILDYDKLIFPLSIRSYREAEYFMPLGMKGRKKLSDFMIDEKVPLSDKNQQAVIISKNNVVWVVGRRIDDRYKVTARTKRLFVITLLPPD